MNLPETFKPLVSIVIPVYNGANYMREAIDSALVQTYKNIEIIVVNDGSNDGGETDRILNEYGDRIRYFQKPNGGCGSALNFGISNMRGTYFSWLSHDDVYTPEKIEHQINVLKSLDNPETILYGGWEGIDSESKSICLVRLDTAHPLNQLNKPLYALLRGLIHGCALLIPAKYFHTIGMFDESLPTTQDYALWFNIFRIAPIHFDPSILIKARTHTDQGRLRDSTHVQECNELWSGFLRRLTDSEMVDIEGSRYLFLYKTAQFLALTPYDDARHLAEMMAEATLERLLACVATD